MNYINIEKNIDLNDPEGEFIYSYDGNLVTLSLIDWRAKKIVFKFENVYSFKHMTRAEYNELPEAGILEIQNSSEIERLINQGTACTNDNLCHYVISTNEEEWCDIIASSYDVEIES